MGSAPVFSAEFAAEGSIQLTNLGMMSVGEFDAVTGGGDLTLQIYWNDDGNKLARYESFLDQTDELIKIMTNFSQPKPIWITEMCFNTHIHPYGTSELRQPDLLVRLYVLGLASRTIDKVFWWTLKDGGTRQFDQADMVGLMRADLSPKYGYHAYAFMTRMLEGKRWLRNDAFGPDVFACVEAGDDRIDDARGSRGRIGLGGGGGPGGRQRRPALSLRGIG